jgi:hypothetical protein
MYILHSDNVHEGVDKPEDTKSVVSEVGNDSMLNCGDETSARVRIEGDEAGCVPETRTRAGIDVGRCARVVILTAAGERERERERVCV